MGARGESSGTRIILTRMRGSLRWMVDIASLAGWVLTDLEHEVRLGGEADVPGRGRRLRTAAVRRPELTRTRESELTKVTCTAFMSASLIIHHH